MFLRYWIIDGFSTVGQRLCDFTTLAVSASLPLWAVLLIVFLLKALSFLAVGWVGLSLSKFTKNETLSILTGVGAAGMTAVLLYRLSWSISVGLLRAL